MHEIDAESPFSLLKPGERRTSLAEQRTDIKSYDLHANRVIFIMEDGPDIVGWIGGWGERFARVKHSIWLSMAVKQAYRRQGIGRQLIGALEDWARDSQLRRIELQVVTTNLPALQLYQTAGYEIEGTRRGVYLLDGEYLDEYFMAKHLQ